MKEYSNQISLELQLQIKSIKTRSDKDKKIQINEILIRSYQSSLSDLNFILESDFKNLIDLDYKDGRAFEFLCINSSKTGNVEKVKSLLVFAQKNNQKISQISINNALLSMTGDFNNKDKKIPLLNLLFNKDFFPNKPDISHANYACIKNLCMKKVGIFEELLNLNEIPYSDKILNILKINKRKDLISHLEHFHFSLESKNKDPKTDKRPKI